VEITGQEWIKQDRRGYKKDRRGYNKTKIKHKKELGKNTKLASI